MRITSGSSTQIQGNALSNILPLAFITFQRSPGYSTPSSHVAGLHSCGCSLHLGILAQPESKIEEMVNKMIEAAPGNEIPKLIEEADKIFGEQKFEEALELFENLTGMDPGNPKIIAGMLRCLLQLKRYDDVSEMFDSLEEKILEDENISKIKKLFDTTSKGKSEIIDDELINKVNSDPQNMDLRFELANNYLSSSETERGFNELLILFEQNPTWNDGAAKKKLLEFFDLLGFNDPNVISARKKLSSMMFK